MDRNSYQHHKNSFLDEDEGRQRPSSAAVRPSSASARPSSAAARPSSGMPRPTPGSKGPRKPVKRHLPIVLVIAVDVVIAALALLIFSLFYFIIPRDQGGHTVALPTPTRQVSASAQPDVNETASASAATEQSAVADSSDFGAKFPDKFTDGNVEQTENAYKSANINVSIDKKSENGVTYFIADIYVKNLKCFRTAFAQGTFGFTDTTDVTAQQNNAIIAINGDYCVNNQGPVVRNGEMPRDTLHTSDLLVMGWDGVMTTYSPQDFNLNKVKSDGAWQVWTFGPMLLKDGQPMTEFNSTVAGHQNPRTAVGYYEPGHYCFIVVDGRQPGYSDGMTMAQLSQLFANLGCSTAYNLDGGQTSEMAFMGKLTNQPYDGGRKVSDIIYIADIAGE